jgi:hypothetical protein
MLLVQNIVHFNLLEYVHIRVCDYHHDLIQLLLCLSFCFIDQFLNPYKQLFYHLPLLKCPLHLLQYDNYYQIQEWLINVFDEKWILIPG